MSDKKDLYQKLDQILRGMFKYSIILGDWGEICMDSDIFGKWWI